ncbi:DTW domain-containing protein YfiP [Clostridium beijerinckii]|nr:DTW domain-containing protein YfiP [Clostridium beijerinckii]
MESEFKVKQITKLYESCNKCGLPIINCICDIVPKIETKAKILILSTEREFSRPSNTARLLKLVNPESTELILWERVKTPEKLIEYINSDDYEIHILFPMDDDEPVERKSKCKDSEKNSSIYYLRWHMERSREDTKKERLLKEASKNFIKSN